MSILRYYMTPETRQAVIAESNRLIATRAAMNPGRSRGESHDLDEPSEDESLAAGAGMDTEQTSVESVCAGLGARLQLTTSPTHDR